jgi:hypothetical protein
VDTAGEEVTTPWIEAWGSELPEIPEFGEIPLPDLPLLFSWSLTRDITPSQGKHFPTYVLALIYDTTSCLAADHDLEYRVVTHGKIDKTMYGEAAVYRLAIAMKEKYVRPHERAAGAAEEERAGAGSPCSGAPAP